MSIFDATRAMRGNRSVSGLSGDYIGCEPLGTAERLNVES